VQREGVAGTALLDGGAEARNPSVSSACLGEAPVGAGDGFMGFSPRW